MSFSITVPVIERADFAAAVDAAEVQGPPDQQQSTLAATARELLKQLAEDCLDAGVINTPYVGGGASGHAPGPSEGEYGVPSLGVNIYGRSRKD